MINKIDTIVYGVVIVLQRKIKTTSGKSECEVQFKIEWSGET